MTWIREGAFATVMASIAEESLRPWNRVPDATAIINLDASPNEVWGEVVARMDTLGRVQHVGGKCLRLSSNVLRNSETVTITLDERDESCCLQLRGWFSAHQKRRWVATCIWVSLANVLVSCVFCQSWKSLGRVPALLVSPMAVVLYMFWSARMLLRLPSTGDLLGTALRHIEALGEAKGWTVTLSRRITPGGFEHGRIYLWAGGFVVGLLLWMVVERPDALSAMLIMACVAGGLGAPLVMGLRAFLFDRRWCADRKVAIAQVAFVQFLMVLALLVGVVLQDLLKEARYASNQFVGHERIALVIWVSTVAAVPVGWCVVFVRVLALLAAMRARLRQEARTNAGVVSLLLPGAFIWAALFVAFGWLLWMQGYFALREIVTVAAGGTSASYGSAPWWTSGVGFAESLGTAVSVYLLVCWSLPPLYVVVHVMIQIAIRIKEELSVRVLEPWQDETALAVAHRLAEGGVSVPYFAKIRSPAIIIGTNVSLFRRGRVLVSDGAAARLPVEALEAAMIHELYHLKHHRMLLVASDVMSAITLAGYGVMSALVDWERLEENADRCAVMYMVRRYGNVDPLIEGVRKTEVVNSALGVTGEDRRVLGLWSGPGGDASAGGVWRGLRDVFRLVYFGGIVGYSHPRGARRERLIRMLAAELAPEENEEKGS